MPSMSKGSGGRRPLARRTAAEAHTPGCIHQTRLNAVVVARPPPPGIPARMLVENAPVIVLSSDDEDDAPYVPPATRKRGGVAGPGTKGKGKGKTRDGKEKEKEREKEKEAESSVVVRLRAEREELKRECERYKGMYHKEQVAAARAAAEKDEVLVRTKELEKNLKRKASAAFPEYSDLDDSVSCEICTTSMWRPATLGECGHTFCESCLHDWFNTTYTAHVAAHPAFLQGPQVLIHDTNRRDPAMAAAIEAIRAEWRKRVPQPVYTCPTCREPVRKRPLEIFFVKEVVRKVAKVTGGEGGEGSPPPARAVNRAVGSLWDGFFPKK